MRSVILHYHIFKNAGMSVEDMLDRNFGERFCRLDNPDPNSHIANDEVLAFLQRNPHVQAVSSHQIRYPVPAAPGFLFFDLCILRDPLDRIRSMYDYTRQKPIEGDAMSELANRLDLGGFVEHLLTRMPHWICNAQAAVLGGCAATVLQASFLGVVDCFEESLAAGEFFLRPMFSGLRCAAPAVNVSRGLDGTLAERKREMREACGSRLYEELESRNVLDLELVTLARAEVERRFSLASR